MRFAREPEAVAGPDRPSRRLQLEIDRCASRGERRAGLAAARVRASRASVSLSSFTDPSSLRFSRRRPIIATIDENGLKRRILRKHKESVERFLDDVAAREYRSEVAEKCRTRIAKCRSKLFTFLDHDGVPWNNNGAENAIKDFAMLRRSIGGASTESGMCDYLLLLSIRQTLKRRGFGFLEFLLSGKKDLDRFALR